MRFKLLVLLALVVPFALSTEDADARACTRSGGVVDVEELPHQAAIHRCYLGGNVVSAWKHVDGKNVLILDWSVNW